MKSILQRKNLIAIAFIVITLLNVSAQTATIAGKLTDKETGQPIDDAEITLESQAGHMHCHSDTLGLFSLTKLDKGTYNVEVYKLGYKKNIFSITLTEGETKRIETTLVFNLKTLQTIDIEADKPVSAASSQYISQVDFNNRPKNSAQDMLRLVPGLFIAQHAGGGKAEQIFIRGFDCDHGTDVATFVDGIPVNMPSHGHGQGYADLHFLIPEVVKGMDISKGPYAPQYGDFATGAAIQFNTMDTLTNNLVQLEAGYVPMRNSITAKRGLFMLQLPDVGSKVTSYVAADIINNSGYFENSQDFNRVNFFSKTVLTLNENSKLKFSVGGFGSSWNASGQVPERAVNAGIISRFGSIDPSEGGTTQRDNFNLSYQTKLSNGEFESNVYSSTYRFKLFSNFTFFNDDPVHGDEIEQDDSRTIKGANAKYSVEHKLGEMKNRFSLGTSFRADEIENELWHAQKRIRLEQRAHAIIHERSTGVYVNEVFRFTPKLRAEVGLRYDYFIFDVADKIPTDSTHTNYTGFNYQALFSPKLNIIYSVNNNVQLFINAGSGYHSNDARVVVQDPNNHQLPRATGAELGSLSNIGNKLVLSAAIWWMDLTNELVYSGDDGTIENRGASRREGIDVSARVQLNQWLYLDADLNLAKCYFLDTVFGARKATNYNIPLAPIATSAGGVTVKLKNKIEASLRYRYMSKRPANDDNTVITREYNVFDFTMNYKIKKAKIGVVIENLLNTKWNEAQFDNESRLPFETKAVSELHFTPGTPFFAKLIFSYAF